MICDVCGRTFFVDRDGGQRTAETIMCGACIERLKEKARGMAFEGRRLWPVDSQPPGEPEREYDPREYELGGES